jgi:hypothetical protein
VALKPTYFRGARLWRHGAGPLRSCIRAQSRQRIAYGRSRLQAFTVLLLAPDARTAARCGPFERRCRIAAGELSTIQTVLVASAQ